MKKTLKTFYDNCISPMKVILLKRKVKKLIKIADSYKTLYDIEKDRTYVLSHYKTKYKNAYSEVTDELIKWKKYAFELQVNQEKQNSQFSDNELKTLIRLCHPDKHSGKDSATIMTKKLILMRNK